MPARKSRKCKVFKDKSKGLQLKPCAGLEQLMSSNNRGLGIRRQQLFNIAEMKPTRELWTIHSGEHAKKGIVLNYCPMCGTDLRPMFADFVESKKATATEDK